MVEIDQHEIRLRPRRQPAEIVAHQRRRAAHRRGVEQIVGRHGGDVARRDAGQHRRLAHLLDQVVRRAIGAEPHDDAGAQIVAEILHDWP